MTQTSAQELALAKPLKHSMKFAAKSSGLSLAEKAVVTGVEAAGKKMFSISATGSGATCAPKRALNLFDSGLSALDDGTAPLEWPQKCSQETSSLVSKTMTDPLSFLYRQNGGSFTYQY
jgi:hypothetical protein